MYKLYFVIMIEAILPSVTAQILRKAAVGV